MLKSIFKNSVLAVLGFCFTWSYAFASSSLSTLSTQPLTQLQHTENLAESFFTVTKEKSHFEISIVTFNLYETELDKEEKEEIEEEEELIVSLEKLAEFYAFHKTDFELIYLVKYNANNLSFRKQIPHADASPLHAVVGIFQI